MTDSPRCAEVRELLPELAMGVAPGDQRAAALAHLAGCESCREALAETAPVIDELMLLAPSHEPPAGFESRVLSAYERPRRRWVPLVAAAAAIVVLAALAATLVTRSVGSEDRQLADQYRRTLAIADGSYLRAAELSAGAGHVFAYQGKPSWVFMTVSDAPSGRYSAELVTLDGRTIEVGWCRVRDGRGSWGTAIPVPVREIDRLDLRSPEGTTLSASFAG